MQRERQGSFEKYLMFSGYVFILGFGPYSLALSSLTWHPVRKMVQQLTDNADLELANERETREGRFNLFS